MVSSSREKRLGEGEEVDEVVELQSLMPLRKEALGCCRLADLSSRRVAWSTQERADSLHGAGLHGM